MLPDLRADSLRPALDDVHAHSDTASTNQDDSRAKRQLDALVTFVKGRNSFGAASGGWGLERAASHFYPSDSLNIEGLSVLDTPTWTSEDSTHSQTAYHSPSVSPRHGPVVAPDIHQHPGREGSDSTGHFELSSVPRRTSLIYAQASSLLLAGMDIDGVLFLNAPRSTSRNTSRRSSYVSTCELRPENATAHRRYSCVSSDSEWYERVCEPLGSSYSERYHANAHLRPSHTLTQGLLHDLFTSFPQGKIFNLLETQGVDPIHQALVDGLAQSFPDAESVLFLPFWDWDKARWIAAAVIWTCQEHFAEHDLHYLQVFSDTIVSELAQIDRTTSNKSKNDLLSSVSHELRSPLHGMLANSELLQSTSLDPAQRDMLTMINTCGHTLLDTMSHLLDFAKINNLTNLHKLSAKIPTQIDDLTSDFDLDILVEDVTDSLYAGHKSRSDSSEVAGRYSPADSRTSYKATNDNEDSTLMNDLSVVARIDERGSWKIQSVSGAWGRIIMNVLGNAFKFTRSGLIEISLAQTQIWHHDSKSNYAHIHITDTGCGISQEYLQNRLFTPFSQERILTEGVGLGLSISHQLVTHLGGQIEVKSEVGVGTQVDIQIPVQFAEGQQMKREPGPNVHQDTRATKRVCLVGLSPSIGSKEDMCRLLSPETKRKLAIRGAMSSILLRQKGWKLSFAETLDRGSGDIAVLEESTLKELARRGPVKTAFRSVIVLGKHGTSAPPQLGLEGEANLIYIPQPFCPRRILQAVQTLGGSHPHTGCDEATMDYKSDKPMPADFFAAAFAANHGLESPPAVRESVSDYPARSAESPQRGLHVLIVDDNDINLKVLSTFMRKIGCTYDTASNGLVAVEKYKLARPRFDYVLMDISMPIMDGITASSRIREYEYEGSLRECKILAVTGVASTEIQEDAFAAGIDEYLVKPLSLHDLKRTMDIA